MIIHQEAMDNSEANESTEYDYLFKIVLVGDSGTGKSCITNRFIANQFHVKYESTIGVDFHVRTVVVEGKLIKLQVWDTAGQERFRTIVPNYYRSSHGVVLVYDCTDKKSYEHLNDWFREVDRYASEDADRIIVGNKCDYSNIRKVDYKTGKSYADALGIQFYETSAKSGANVEKMFIELAASIKRRVDASFPAAERNIQFNDNVQMGKSTRCC